MKLKRVVLGCVGLAVLLGGSSFAEPKLKSRTVIETFEEKEVFPDDPSAKKVAIFTANRAEAELNDQMPVFEDMLISQVADLGFEVISREVVLSATGDLLKTPAKNELDALLDDQTSSLRLAQNLGADYLLFASFVGLDTEVRNVKAYGVDYENQVFTLRGTYRILDGNTGGSLTAGMVEPSRAIQQTKHSQTSTTGLMRELLAKASKEMAASLKQKNAQIREVQVAKEQVEFQILAMLNGLSFPEAEVDAEGNVKIVDRQSPVEALAVTVEIDGIAVGTTGSGALTASPGIHRIRMVRDDLVPYERTINIVDGMKMNIALDLNAAGLNRWREKTAVYNQLLQLTKLNDAQVDVLRGQAQMLRQSGYKIDIKSDAEYKSDIKVDTDEGIDVKNNQSLFNQD